MDIVEIITAERGDDVDQVLRMSDAEDTDEKYGRVFFILTSVYLLFSLVEDEDWVFELFWVDRVVEEDLLFLREVDEDEDEDEDEEEALPEDR
ncbi:MAG: hypothetical protein U5N26_03720 [Candidatus Marinimicrobia bacterium]|nr:hypothetical protein [Candidatus Neomarinimicrobiota bacterium]